MTKLGASLSRTLAALAVTVLAAGSPFTSAQQKQSAGKDSKPAPTEKNAAQIELLETKYRFETNGDSRKEVHARVRINNELGARQFARLNFDFNRSFQSVEIPLVRVTHASGGTADILPGAITDNPNPTVVDYPAYHDVRVKSVRILGLQPDDVLEYRVVTTTTHHPLAPDFWLDHTFDRSGVLSHEIFEIDLPAAIKIKPKINPGTPSQASPTETEGSGARDVYRWDRKAGAKQSDSDDMDKAKPDISVSTFHSWDQLAGRLAPLLFPTQAEVMAMRERACKISEAVVDGETGKFYEFVSQKIKTVDLPLDSTGYRTRTPEEILQSGYGSAEDKFKLFATLSGGALAGFASDSSSSTGEAAPSPARFNYLLTFGHQVGPGYWLDLNAEVAPEGMVPSQFRSKPIFVIGSSFGDPIPSRWDSIDSRLPPFRGSQGVSVRASVDGDGKLLAKVHYAIRGENELTLRVAFHKTEKEKWKDVAQMLALSDGFRGQIVDVTASDPYASKEPFTVEYEISQPKFADWSKKTVRIPAILPLAGLPDPPSAEQIEKKKPIQLGTPLAIDLEATIELPAGATAQAPIGTTVNRDYATFTSKYSVQGTTLHASRSLHFLSSELPWSRATDFNAFLHAVQADQTQLFTVRIETGNKK